MAPQHRLSEELVRAAQRARAAAEEELQAAARAREAAERAALDAERRTRDLDRELERQRAAAERERARARERAETDLAAASAELAELRRHISAARRAEGARARAAGDATGDRDRHLGAASEAQGRARRALAPEAPARGGTAVVGDPVLDPAMGFRGVVVSVEGDQAEVQGDRVRMRLPLARLVPDPRGRPAAVPAPVEARPELRAAPPELDVRGERAEAARAMVRDAIDTAAMVGRGRLRIIHGHGTGALRTAVRQELARHPLVHAAEAAPPNEGGDGATYAVLDPDGAA